MLELLGPSTGGIRQHVAWLTGALRERGWTVRTAGPPGVLDDLVEQDAVVAVPRGWRALRGAIGRADLVHAHGLKAGWLASTVPRRPPLVVTVHNLVLDEVARRAAPVLRRLEGMLPGRVDAVIAVSDEIGRRFGAAGNVHVSHPRVRARSPAGRARRSAPGSDSSTVSGSSSPSPVSTRRRTSRPCSRRCAGSTSCASS